MADTEAKPELGELELLQREIEHWRRERPQMGEMPAPLWEKATAVARKLGVYRAAKTLRLNYAALKQRVIPTHRRRSLRGRRAVPNGDCFVEVSNAPLARSRAAEGTMVEVVAIDGTRLIVRLAGTSIDLPALLSVFRDQR